jgi:hypothetical protein
MCSILEHMMYVSAQPVILVFSPTNRLKERQTEGKGIQTKDIADQKPRNSRGRRSLCHQEYRLGCTSYRRAGPLISWSSNFRNGSEADAVKGPVYFRVALSSQT